MVKRAVDLVGALAALVLLLPLGVLIAITIKLDSPGPLFFAQARVGLRGRLFRLYKFRTMVAGDTGPSLTGRGDRRITRVGNILRLVRLDEAPQLWNVLKGNMSLVGPRPEVPWVVEQYTPEQWEVLDVRPGLTGPTQLLWLDEEEMFPPDADASRHYTRHFLPEKLESDLRYVRTRSLGQDLRCLLRTPLTIGRTARTGLRPIPGLQKGARWIADCLAVAAANLGAFLVRFDWAIPAAEGRHLAYGLPIGCLAYALSFLTLRTYRGIWRYASVEDLWQVSKAATLGGSLHALAVFLLGWDGYPRSVLVSTALLYVLLTGGMRVLARWGFKAQKPAPADARRRRVVIVGAGEAGESIARELRGDPTLGYDLLGFVDDDPTRQGETIHNLPVLGTVERLADLARHHHVQEAIVAIPALSGGEMRRLAAICAQAGLKFKVLPSLAQLMRGEGKLRYLRDVKTDDLLRRPAASIDEARIRPFLDGKRVMVTGAGGSIGSELCRQVVRLGAESLIMVERAENALNDVWLELRDRYPEAAITAALADVQHLPPMSDIFEQFKPHVVFHAAAYKHVPILENHPAEAVLNNVVGTKRLTEVARAFGAETFVFISTDKAVAPTSLMGATKKICEMYLAALNAAPRPADAWAACTRFLVVRFGNVLGSAGSVVSLFQRQIDNGDPITITDPEASRFFMTLAEAVGLVLESISMESPGDVLVLNMGEPVKIGELADDLAVNAGLSPAEVARKYVGLRPGERMHERLWEDGEEVLAIERGKILVIRARPKAPAAEALVEALERLALRGDAPGLLQKIREAVPSYCPPAGGNKDGPAVDP